MRIAFVPHSFKIRRRRSQTFRRHGDSQHCPHRRGGRRPLSLRFCAVQERSPRSGRKRNLTEYRWASRCLIDGLAVAVPNGPYASIVHRPRDATDQRAGLRRLSACLTSTCSPPVGAAIPATSAIGHRTCATGLRSVRHDLHVCRRALTGFAPEPVLRRLTPAVSAETAGVVTLTPHNPTCHRTGHQSARRCGRCLSRYTSANRQIPV